MSLSPFLDLVPDEAAVADQLAAPDTTLTGWVTSVVDAGQGLVSVAIDGADGSHVVARADAGLTYVGARVTLPRDSTGRVASVSAPAGATPAGPPSYRSVKPGVRSWTRTSAWGCLTHSSPKRAPTWPRRRRKLTVR